MAAKNIYSEKGAYRRLNDGTVLRRRDDGFWIPVQAPGAPDAPKPPAGVAAKADSGADEEPRPDPSFAAAGSELWTEVNTGRPQKQAIFIKLDQDLVDHFKAQGRGYQTRINAVLRQYVDRVKKTG